MVLDIEFVHNIQLCVFESFHCYHTHLKVN